MNDAPLISVCIANYNGSAIISACIKSVLTQDSDIPVEILVHDDASTDDSADIVARDYPGVRLMRSEANVGFCVANNRMVDRAQGEFILLLNNDAELFPDALRALLEEARSLGKPAILSVPQYDYGSGALVDRGCLLDPFFNPVPNLDPNRQDVAMVIGACLWIPKDLWNRLGAFPEWFGSIAEDMYLCCRARLLGCAVRVLAASGYWHWQGTSFGGNRVADNRLVTTFRRRALSERNKSYVITTTAPSSWMYIILFLHVILLMLEGWMMTLTKQDCRFWRDIYAPCFQSLWRERSRLWGVRKSVQKSRAVSAVVFFSVFGLIPRKLYLLARYGLPQVR